MPKEKRWLRVEPISATYIFDKFRDVPRLKCPRCISNFTFIRFTEKKFFLKCTTCNYIRERKIPEDFTVYI